MKVTFIGLGIMGSRMAKNLLKNQVRLTVWNRSTAPMEELAAAGAKPANSMAEAVAGADVVFTMLSKPEVVEKVAMGPDGFVSNMEKDTLWVDCSTVNPSFSRQSHAFAKEQGIRFLEAPVAGTKPHAANAKLTFFVGGNEKNLEQAEPMMKYMGQKVLHLGGEGTGSSFKMLVNALLAQSMIIFSEAVLLGESMGLSKDFLLNSLPNLPVSAPFTVAKADMIRNNDYEVQFPLELMHKDLHLATLTAYECGQSMYLANVAKELFGNAEASGMGRLDFAAIYQYLSGKK